MQSSVVTKIYLNRPGQTNQKEIISKPETKQRYYIDFNSRLIIPPRKLSFKPAQSPQRPNSNSITNTNRNSSFSFSEHSSIGNTQTIKQRLKKILQKQVTKNHSTQALDSRETLILEEIEKPNKTTPNKITKSLFFRSNLKMNKNKKQLEDLSKRSILQSENQKRQSQQQSKGFNMSATHNKKIQDEIFIVKEIKLRSNKINMSPMSTQNNRNDKKQTNYDNSNFMNDHQIFPTFNVFRQSIVCNSRKKPKNTGHKVLTIFQKYDQQWYNKQQELLMGTQQGQQSRMYRQNWSIRNKIKPKLIIKSKKKQDYLQPWKPNIVDSYLGIHDSDTSF